MSRQWNDAVLSDLFTALKQWTESITYSPIIDLMAAGGDTPWQILVSTMLSARTRDQVTAAASKRLFTVAKTAKETEKLSIEQLEKLIFPVGFYKTKAKNISKLATDILTRFNGTVPDSVALLISLPGIGIKTASLVVIKAFHKDDICVDTHVHRIANMWGFVTTDKPEQTREQLKRNIPLVYWQDINQYLVTLGQLICRPTKHECQRCPVKQWCPAANQPIIKRPK